MPHKFKKRHPKTAPTPLSTTTPQHNPWFEAAAAATTATSAAAATPVTMACNRTSGLAVFLVAIIIPEPTVVTRQGKVYVAAHHRHWDDWYLKTRDCPLGGLALRNGMACHGAQGTTTHILNSSRH